MIHTKTIPDQLFDKLSEQLGKKITVTGINPVGGGSINAAYQVRTTKQDFFVKKNDATKYPLMFNAEKKGLELLYYNAKPLRVPKVDSVTTIDGQQYLVMEYIRAAPKTKDFYELLALGLASMHSGAHEEFGFDHDNYIGRLPQFNSYRETWSKFFVEQRLEKQVHQAVDSGAISIAMARQFLWLYERMDSLFPKELPSLLHGDLWSGNVMADENGKPCIYDPAVYFGHREMDIAMTKLFGGFPDEFYQIYNGDFEMEKGWEERMDLCNLYPLMVHVNLFGGSYVEDVKNILQRFTA